MFFISVQGSHFIETHQDTVFMFSLRFGLENSAIEFTTNHRELFKEVLKDFG
jgi:hypothetical protein